MLMIVAQTASHSATASLSSLAMRSSSTVAYVLLCLKLAYCSQNSDYRNALAAGEYGSYPVHTFTSSKAKAPVVNLVDRSSACDDGRHYFITPRGWKVSQPGPMILDGTGSMIWTDHFSTQIGGQAYDLRVQKYKGEDHLTFWLGDDRVRGHGAGCFYVLNSSYDVVHKIGAADGRYADLHEFFITPNDTALVILFEPIQADVRPVGRKFSDVWAQAAYDCLFQEVDIETGKLIFEWRSSEHLNMTDSYVRIETPDMGTREKPFDWIHLNSVAKDELGNYLISARNLHAVLYIDGRTKEVLWTLGGVANDFQDVSNGHVLNMAWQHDARFVSSGAFQDIYSPPMRNKDMVTRLMTIFDNAALDWNYDYGPDYSRGLLLELTYPMTGHAWTGTHKVDVRDTGTNTVPTLHSNTHLSEKDFERVKIINGTNPAYKVRIISELIHPKQVRSSTQGSVQLVPQTKGESKFLVGYGINPVITEFSSNGSVLCDLHFGATTAWEKGDVQSYRAYKSHWIGRPGYPPSVTVRRNVAYVSWNGATEVRGWLLQVSSALQDGKDWTEVTRVPKTEFETAIALRSSDYQVSGRYVRLLALGGDDQILANGISAVIDRSFFGRHKLLRFLDSNTFLIRVTAISMASVTGLAILWKACLRRSRYTPVDSKQLDLHAD